jgi:peroxiredoxin
VLEPGEIELNVDKDTLFKTTTAGTYNNDKLEEFKKVSYKMYQDNQKMEKASLAKRNEAIKTNDTVTLNTLRKEKEKVFKTWNTQLVDFIKKNPKAYVNIMILGQVAQMRVTSMDEVKKIFDGLDPSIKKTKEGKQIADYFAKLEAEKKGIPDAAAQPNEGGVKVGDVAPDFTAPSPEGKAVSLKQSLGKVTIVDFWASWCKPCRAENPNVVALYNELHGKGLNIIGVSLDKTADKWKEAIAADKLTWAHVSNLKFWDEPIAKQYGVTSIPATFILDASGKIVAKDLRGAELKAKVTELLGK